jgi:hypothetical protein
MSLLQEMEEHGLVDCDFNRALSILDVIRADIFNYTDFDAPDSLSDLQNLKSTLEDSKLLESLGITVKEWISAALVIVNKDIDKLTDHFDNVVFPDAVNFVDLKAKAAVNPSAVITAIFDSYEAGNNSFLLNGRFTKSGFMEVFTWEFKKCI